MERLGKIGQVWRRVSLALCLGCLALPALAQSVSVSVGNAWVRGTVAGQRTSGVFMELTARDDAALAGVSSPVAGSTELHEMIMDNGIMRMRPLARLELPAGKTVALRPGSYHIMLLDLKQPLKAGERVPLVLRIQNEQGKATLLEVSAEVRSLTAPNAPEGASASEHSHHHMH